MVKLAQVCASFVAIDEMLGGSISVHAGTCIAGSRRRTRIESIFNPGTITPNVLCM